MNYIVFASIGTKIKIFFQLVKIEHSIFALPFAYIGLFLAAQGWPGKQKFLLLTLAMVSIRSWSMAINRLGDLKFDRLNPRTQSRPLPRGQITVKQTIGLLIVTALIFIISCAYLNTLCFKLSFLALLWSALYSLSKRITWLSHFWLGSVLGLAPLGGWLAFDPAFTLQVMLFFWGVTFWVAGFDILYAVQDIDFDQRMGLYSIPVCFGIDAAFLLSTFSHIVASLFFLIAGLAAQLGLIYFFCWLITFLILLQEHRIVSLKDLNRINTAFFTMNGFVAVFLSFGVILDVFWVG